MRSFNTSGPNIAEEHYTIERTSLINKGIDLVEKKSILPSGHHARPVKVPISGN